ncbi:uncharacterized protein N7483_005457 [Penicillium malachiteum]|uniref:uncharacterized protein n=1 Tax=Penicillium malachiteum TaxID=1324776 RepID=UPI00254962B8|nr:uncharacterized protein N7483_005457 [Penicillium malachiteum]KAJ5730949.1 hypothetical protein N7483_005457 [Penicillium malachiteum]
MRLSLVSAVALAISAGVLTNKHSALSVTEPQKGSNIGPSSSVTVKWTSVDTDASHFDIYLVNNAVYPPVNKELAKDIETSKDSYTVNIGDVPNGHGYQINLVSDASMNTGILAQTGQFNVTDSSETSSSSTTSSATTTWSSTGSSTSTSSASSSITKGSTGVVISTSTGVSTTVAITTAVNNTHTAGTTGMVTTASGSTGAQTTGTNSTAAPLHSTNAGAAILAHPAAAVGVVGGALAFML